MAFTEIVRYIWPLLKHELKYKNNLKLIWSSMYIFIIIFTRRAKQFIKRNTFHSGEAFWPIIDWSRKKENKSKAENPGKEEISPTPPSSHSSAAECLLDEKWSNHFSCVSVGWKRHLRFMNWWVIVFSSNSKYPVDCSSWCGWKSTGFRARTPAFKFWCHHLPYILNLGQVT